MLLLTLNMNMFNFVIDNSFDDYYAVISPDIAFVQECRYNRINKQYDAKWAGDFEEPIDSRFHLSAAISKENEITKSKIDTTGLTYDYTCIFVEYEKNRFAGVHIPLDKESENESERKDILKKIKESDSKIICGDFNACSNNENQEYLEELLSKNGYIDLWQEGINQRKAYYIDFSGRKMKANSEKHLKIRTFVGNRHIDYILAKNEFLNLKEIIIDYRTLAFTDHCGIILDFDINQKYK